MAAVKLQLSVLCAVRLRWCCDFFCSGCNPSEMEFWNFLQRAKAASAAAQPEAEAKKWSFEDDDDDDDEPAAPDGAAGAPAAAAVPKPGGLKPLAADDEEVDPLDAFMVENTSATAKQAADAKPQPMDAEADDEVDPLDAFMAGLPASAPTAAASPAPPAAAAADAEAPPAAGAPAAVKAEPTANGQPGPAKPAAAAAAPQQQPLRRPRRHYESDESSNDDEKDSSDEDDEVMQRLSRVLCSVHKSQIHCVYPDPVAAMLDVYATSGCCKATDLLKLAAGLGAQCASWQAEQGRSAGARGSRKHRLRAVPPQLLH